MMNDLREYNQIFAGICLYREQQKLLMLGAGRIRHYNRPGVSSEAPDYIDIPSLIFLFISQECNYFVAQSHKSHATPTSLLPVSGSEEGKKSCQNSFFTFTSPASTCLVQDISMPFTIMTPLVIPVKAVERAPV